MKREEFVNKFIILARKKLTNNMPDEASEGLYMVKAFEILIRMARHVLTRKVEVTNETTIS